jgi:hypothetical protein
MCQGSAWRTNSFTTGQIPAGTHPRGRITLPLRWSESRGKKKNSAPACYWTPISCLCSPYSSHYTYRVPINICTRVIYYIGNVSNITHVWRNFYFNSATVSSGPEPPHYRGFTITLRQSHSVGLLWTGDQPEAGTCTWQHTTLTKDRF